MADEDPARRRRWRLVYAITLVYGVLTIVALWSFTAAFRA